MTCRLPKLRRSACAVLALWMVTPAPLPAQTKDAVDETSAFFSRDKIMTLKIELGPKELESLRRDPRKYVKATFKEGDKIVGADIGVHVKGAAGSFRGIDDKPSLTLNMDKFTDGQRFHGMDKFHLANSLQDPSYLSELICGELFRAAGVPASRVTHAVVVINDRRRGLYYVKEGYDRIFLKRNFQNNHGNFYDGGFLRDIDQPLQLLSSKGDAGKHADLKALVMAAREGDLQKRFQKLERLLDLDKFISFLVLESFMWDWDGYPMNRNNYRVYHDPVRDKLIFIPSGMDQMFGNPGGPLLPDFQGLAARALIETPEGRKRYLTRASEIMRKSFRHDELGKRLDTLQARLQPVLTTLDAGAGRDYANQVNRLRQGIVERAKSIEDQLKRLKL